MAEPFSLIDYIDSHQAEFWVFLGFALLALEILVLSLASGVLLFGAIGALLTGLVMMVGLLPETWVAGMAGFGVLSALSTAALWHPLRRLQNDNEIPERDRSSDLIGYEFLLEQPIDVSRDGETMYSGIRWTVRPDPQSSARAIAAGTRVTVTTVDVGVFWVTPTKQA